MGFGGPQAERAVLSGPDNDLGQPSHRHTPEKPVASSRRVIANSFLDGSVAANTTAAPIESDAIDAQLSALKTQNAYLQDQVVRLNVQLARYQQKVPAFDPNADTEPLTSVEAAAFLPPWLLDSKIAAPLLVAYDQFISELNGSIKQYESEMSVMEKQMQGIVDENEELHERLQEQIDLAFKRQEFQEEQGTGSLSGLAVSRTQVLELQERIDILTEENDVLIQQIQEQSTIMDRLQEERDDLASSLDEAEKTMKEEATRAKESVLASNRAAANQLEELDRQLKNVQKDLEDETRTLTIKKKELNAAHDRISSLEKLLKEKTGDINDAQHAAVESTGKLDAARKQVKELSEEIDRYCKELSDWQRKDRESTLQVEELISACQDATLKQEMAETNAEQLQEEVTRLQGRLDEVLEGQARITKSEIDKARADARQQGIVLQKEIDELRNECARLEVAVERAQRDKSSVEDELHRAKQEMGSGMPTKVKEMSARIEIAMRERDEALELVERTRSASSQFKRQWEAEKEVYSAQATSAEHRLSEALEREKLVRHEKQVAVSTVESLKSDLQVAEDELERLRQRANDDVAATSSRLESTVKNQSEQLEKLSKELQVKSEQVRNLVHEKSELIKEGENRVQEAVTEQQLLVEELRTEVNRLQQRNESLSQKYSHAMKQIGTETMNQEKVEMERKRLLTRVEQSDSRTRQLSRQIADHIRREEELLKGKRDVQMEVDRLTLQLQRCVSERDDSHRKLVALQDQLQSLQRQSRDIRTPVETENRPSRDRGHASSPPNVEIVSELDSIRRQKEKLRKRLKKAQIIAKLLQEKQVKVGAVDHDAL